MRGNQAELREWLKKRVRTYATPRRVTLSGFRVNASEYEGSFNITLDNEKVPRRFTFSLQSNGKPELGFPIFTSPLGVPASFSAVQLSEETVAAVESLLRVILPPMKGLGLDRETGQEITNISHCIAQRIIDKGAYQSQFRKLREVGF
jgi:hypothetical protein